MNPRLSLVKKRMLRSRNSFVLFSLWLGVLVYSQERIAKKRAPTRSWPMAVLRGFALSLYMRFQTTSGKQAWCFVGGSVFL